MPFKVLSLYLLQLIFESRVISSSIADEFDFKVTWLNCNICKSVFLNVVHLNSSGFDFIE